MKKIPLFAHITNQNKGQILDGQSMHVWAQKTHVETGLGSQIQLWTRS